MERIQPNFHLEDDGQPHVIYHVFGDDGPGIPLDAGRELAKFVAHVAREIGFRAAVNLLDQLKILHLEALRHAVMHDCSIFVSITTEDGDDPGSTMVSAHLVNADKVLAEDPELMSDPSVAEVSEAHRAPQKKTQERFTPPGVEAFGLN